MINRRLFFVTCLSPFVAKWLSKPKPHTGFVTYDFARDPGTIVIPPYTWPVPNQLPIYPVGQ